MTLTVRRRDAATGPARALVVLLHGYGADGADLIGLAEPLAGAFPRAAFLAPDGPEPCRVNPAGRQWFPVPWIDGSTEAEMAVGFGRAAASLDDWLTQAMAAEGVGEADTAVIGFSQGAMMALHVAPRRAAPVAAILGFSGRLIPAPSSPVISRPPVFLAHGDADEVIPVAAIEAARAALEADGFSVETHVSPGLGHGIAPDGLERAARFLAAKLPGAR